MMLCEQVQLKIFDDKQLNLFNNETPSQNVISFRENQIQLNSWKHEIELDANPVNNWILVNSSN